MRDDVKGLVDQEAFEDTLRENQYYKSGLDREWLHNFVSYYESSKHTPIVPEAGDDVEAALRSLVKLKQHKDECGKTLWYEQEQPKAWEAAIAALGKTEGAGDWKEAEEGRRAIQFLNMQGYRRCDIAACNCPYWHGGKAGERLTEIHEVLSEAGLKPYEKTAIVAIKELIAALGGYRLGNTFDLVKGAQAGEAKEAGQQLPQVVVKHGQRRHVHVI